MFTPQYRISDLLLGNIKRITEIVTRLNAQRFPGVLLAELERNAGALSSFSSTSIEGNPLPLTDVKRILKNRPEHIRDSEREVLNYNKALTDLNEGMRRGERPFDLSLLLGIQKAVTDGLVSDGHSGSLRREPVFVNDPKLGKTVYFPPDHADVPGLMTELLDYVEAAEGGVDPLIVAGVFHKWFVTVHPFVDGNGRTARLATKVLLARMGVDTFNLFSFENYYNRNIARYFEEVGEYGNYYDLRDTMDFTSWLEYFTGGIIDELLRVGKELERKSVSPDEFLQKHHLDILEYIGEHGFITDREYAKRTDRARPTRHLDFRKLIDLGRIESVKKGRATYYRLKSEE